MENDFFKEPMREFYNRLEVPQIPKHAARQVALEAMQKGYRMGVEKAAGLSAHAAKNLFEKKFTTLPEHT